jgi:hypothetical protein
LLSAKQVKPGESGQIEVRLNPSGEGRVSKTIRVSTNDPKQSSILLSVRAYVEPEFIMSPRVINFGRVPHGKEVVSESIVTIPAGGSASLVTASTTDENLSVRLGAVLDSNGKSQRIIVALKPDAKEGDHFGVVVIKTTSKFMPELKLIVRSSVIASQSD